MHKKLLILYDKIGPNARLLAEKTNADVATFSDLVFLIGEKDMEVLVKGQSITNYKLVYIRRADHKMFALAGALALFLDSKGIKYFDTAFREMGAAGDKLNSYIKLSLAGLPVIPTFFCKPKEINEYLDIITEKIGFPLVAKEVSSQRGHVYKLGSLPEMDSLPAKDFKESESHYMLQKFIDIGEEYRVLVVGNKVPVWGKKTINVEGEFRRNTYLGNIHEYLDIKLIPPELKDISLRAAGKLNLQVAGVDVAVDKKTGKYVILEVNRGPGFTNDASFSPEFTALLEYINDQLK